MISTKVFMSGNSQAVRIPSSIRTDKEEFLINKIGEAYILYPANDPWFALRQTIGSFPDDFLSDREQPFINDIPEKELL